MHDGLFKPGQSGNPQGRPKGSRNKVSNDLREKITDFLSGQFETIKTLFADEDKKLSPRDKLKFYTELLQYGLPKLSSVSTEIDIDKLSDEDIEDLYRKIEEMANKD